MCAGLLFVAVVLLFVLSVESARNKLHKLQLAEGRQSILLRRQTKARDKEEEKERVREQHTNKRKGKERREGCGWGGCVWGWGGLCVCSRTVVRVSPLRPSVGASIQWGCTLECSAVRCGAVRCRHNKRQFDHTHVVAEKLIMAAMQPISFVDRGMGRHTLTLTHTQRTATHGRSVQCSAVATGGADRKRREEYRYMTSHSLTPSPLLHLSPSLVQIVFLLLLLCLSVMAHWSPHS